jgi:hypothetical protein
MEWLLLLPKLGFLPHTVHTLDMVAFLRLVTPNGKCHSMPQSGAL